MYSDVKENNEISENRENVENVEAAQVVSVDEVQVQAEINEPEPVKCYQWETKDETPRETPKKKKGGVFRKLLLAICCGLCFGLFAGAGLYAVDKLTEWYENSQEEVYQTNSPDSVVNKLDINKQDINKDTGIQLSDKNHITVVTSDYSQVVEQVMPAMVSIVNTYEERINYWGQTFTEESKSSGSGIIIAETETELLIATNNHVVEDASKLEVTFIDGSVIEAKIKGRDADMDLAVITIPLNTLPNEVREVITIAKMGNSDALKLGEPVIAIGNSLGYGQSVTGGYVSALNREIGLSDGSKGTFIQTDAAINQGNSGGALLNINGEVIGINSNKIGGTMVEGMGYAIPISAAEPIIGELMSKETKTKAESIGYIGIENPITVPDEMVEYYNFPKGVFVRSVAKDSPAEKAGIINNDIIVKFDGTKITTFEELQEELTYYGPGSKVEITVMRQVEGYYVEKQITLTLGKRPDDK